VNAGTSVHERREVAVVANPAIQKGLASFRVDELNFRRSHVSGLLKASDKIDYFGLLSFRQLRPLVDYNTTAARERDDSKAMRLVEQSAASPQAR
jgi:hypothetical protein